MPQAVSQSSGVGMGGRRQAPRGAAADDSSNRGGRWRGSGAPGTGHGYELSQDLADMRLEMLERRYVSFAIMIFTADLLQSLSRG